MSAGPYRNHREDVRLPERLRRALRNRLLLQARNDVVHHPERELELISSGSVRPGGAIAVAPPGGGSDLLTIADGDRVDGHPGGAGGFLRHRLVTDGRPRAEALLLVACGNLLRVDRLAKFRREVRQQRQQHPPSRDRCLALFEGEKEAFGGGRVEHDRGLVGPLERMCERHLWQGIERLFLLLVHQTEVVGEGAQQQVPVPVHPFEPPIEQRALRRLRKERVLRRRPPEREVAILLCRSRETRRVDRREHVGGGCRGRDRLGAVIHRGYVFTRLQQRPRPRVVRGRVRVLA